MIGPVSWEQVIFLSSVFAGAIGITARVIWNFLEKNHKARLDQIKESQLERHEMRSHYDQKYASLLDKIEMLEEKLVVRITSLELVSSGQAILMKQLEIFQEDVKKAFNGLRQERRDDMQALHSRLNRLGMQAERIASNSPGSHSHEEPASSHLDMSRSQLDPT